VRQGVNKRLAVDALFFIKESGLLDLLGGGNFVTHMA